MQPWCTPFPIWNYCIVPCLVLTSFFTCIQVAQETGKAVWYSHVLKNFPQFVVIHMVKGFSIVNEAEVDIFLELPCFFYDPMDVGSLISDSSAFSKSSLYIWIFLVHLLLKPNLKDFEHEPARMGNEHNLNILWHCISLGLEWKQLFQSCGPCWVFQICWHIECSTLPVWSFRF